MKSFCKNCLRLFASILVLPLYFFFLLYSRVLGDRKATRAFSQFIAGIPGLIGEAIRSAFYGLILEGFGEGSCVSYGVLFSTRSAKVGKRVYIGPYSLVGEVEIGDETIVGSRVSLLSGAQQHGTESLDVPMREQEGEYCKIHIGKDCWLGEGAIVACDIAEGCIVGTGSVVLKATQPNTINVGNPAREIRKRT